MASTMFQPKNPQKVNHSIRKLQPNSTSGKPIHIIPASPRLNIHTSQYNNNQSSSIPVRSVSPPSLELYPNRNPSPVNIVVSYHNPSPLYRPVNNSIPPQVLTTPPPRINSPQTSQYNLNIRNMKLSPPSNQVNSPNYSLPKPVTSYAVPHTRNVNNLTNLPQNPFDISHDPIHTAEAQQLLKLRQKIQLLEFSLVQERTNSDLLFSQVQNLQNQNNSLKETLNAKNTENGILRKQIQEQQKFLQESQRKYEVTMHLRQTELNSLVTKIHEQEQYIQHLNKCMNEVQRQADEYRPELETAVRNTILEERIKMQEEVNSYIRKLHQIEEERQKKREASPKAGSQRTLARGKWCENCGVLGKTIISLNEQLRAARQGVHPLDILSSNSSFKKQEASKPFPN